MKAQYYTPKIEEFYVGFEYEFNDNVLESEWQNAVIKDGTQIDDITRTYKGANAYSLRVKHLDREDIEEFGGIPHKNIKDYWRIDDFVLRTKDSIISIYQYDEYTVDKLIFQGFIKNKSELKKLMQQLQIC